MESHDDLDEGFVSEDLRQEFKDDKGIVLAENCIIRKQGGNWWIGGESDSNRYFVKKEFLFLANLKFNDTLGNGVIPEKLSQEFERNGISLNLPCTIVTPIKSMGNEWLIKDKETKQAYIASKENNQLTIYEINSYNYFQNKPTSQVKKIIS